MSEEQDRIDAALRTPSEPCDDVEEITKNASRWDQDENPPFVAATVVSAESLAVVDYAEPVHELAVAQILDDGEDYANSTNSNLTTALSQPTTAQRSSVLTERTSSLTSNSASDVLSQQESIHVEQEIVHIDAADDVPCDLPSSEHQQREHQADEEERKFNRMQRYCMIYLAVALVMFISGTVGIVLVALNLGPHSQPTD
jgi:hypothetical protein